MITRIWRGWTTLDNAPVYQELLLTEIFPGIEKRRIAGYRGLSVVRRELDNEVEFVTVMWFESIEAVKRFAGDQYELAVVPPQARAVLSRFDARPAHYETLLPPPVERLHADDSV